MTRMKRFWIFGGWLLLLAGRLDAQEGATVTGRVVSARGQEPVGGALVVLPGARESAVTDSSGFYSLVVPESGGILEITAPGFYGSAKPLRGNVVDFILTPADKVNYNEELLFPFYRGNRQLKASASDNLNGNHFSRGALQVDDLLRGTLAGLRVVKGSGMPGEGSWMNGRGLSTLHGSSAPLVIIDGAPFLPDMSESPLIGGYSANIFNGLTASDIKNITFLRGAETSLYGSLASNGVLIIETDDATDLQTRISFHGQYGMAAVTRTMPLLDISGYKAYLGGAALTRFEDMGDILTEFPFLKDDPSYHYNFLYNNNTDWQDEILNPAFVTENVLKIKGGDAIAKYDLSFGYLGQKGVVDNSGLTRYNMRLKSNINVSQKIQLFASMSLSYLNNALHEQGIIPETNPLLAALAKSPMVSPWKKDEYNNLLPDYAPIRDAEGNIRVNDAVSNPLALVNTTKIANEGSDVLINGGIHYLLTPDLKLTALAGLYNSYTHSELFIPGVSSGAIMPLEGGLADNTVRDGIRETVNMYYNLNADWHKRFAQRHTLRLVAGAQAITTRKEFDAGQGRNSSSDFYKTLDYVNAIGRSFYGYIDKWNWMSFFFRADYNFNRLISAGFSLSADGSSSAGSDSPPFGFFPGVNGGLHLHNLSFLEGADWINLLTLRGEYVRTGNSYFGSNISDYYYRNQPFRQLAGIVRANLPNRELEWEKSGSFNLGLDFTGFGQRLDLTLDLYNRLATDVIVAQEVSPVFGLPGMFSNLATIRNRGVEAGVQLYLFNGRDFRFLVGGTAARNCGLVKSLGGEPDKIVEFDDGSAVITREGEPVYSFYGYRTAGVYATSAEAAAGGLTDYAGNPFGAGDIQFVNSSGDDNRIDDADRVILGSADPALFGSFWSVIRYKQLALTAAFLYSYGNEAYNALRREFETMDDFGNQFVTAERRWQSENDHTDMPRAAWGDPMQNGRFSDRWIEDASFLKLKELTLSYDFRRGDLRILRGGTLYVTGENLLTFTDYLGYDPEFSYSYAASGQGFDLAKVPVPATVKLGFKLQF